MSSTNIWVLGDNRVGNTNQATALADSLSTDYEVKNIKYNLLGLLPNFMLMLYPWHVERHFIKALEDSPAPKLIISSGRRTASISMYLKKKFEHTKFVQILNPEGNINKFDLVILPEHDSCCEYSANIIRTIGAFNKIHTEKNKQSIDFHRYYPDAKNFIAVIIGGDNKKAKFKIEDAENLKNILLKITKNHPIPLFFSFSRRTSKKLKEIIKSNFLWPHIIYDPLEGGYNPYLDVLKEANYIICTGDSISMCSEAASSGIPLYIYGPISTKLKKHKFFVQELVDLGIARRLDANTNRLEKYDYNSLNEAVEIAKLIKQQLLL